VVLTNPTTGGVAASFAALGDVILAEPRAIIGFTGARVIQETLRVPLPTGFQTAEFQRDHGMVDQVVQRCHMAQTLGFLCKLFGDAQKKALPREGQQTLTMMPHGRPI
jgi:acetyl-CoA carboxylase carboxyl transferase subunit beta